MSLEPAVIGNYTIVRQLGEGSFGKIYLAVHNFTRSKVVLKAASKNDPQLVREIHHHRLFKHPHIAQFYEFIITESRVWLVLEYCPNDDLYSYLINYRRISINETRRLFAQICGAVAYTHSKNCAHRDLKLENILLDKHNDAKLSDFGFTREYIPPSFLETVCGTTCYMAPEMLLRKKYAGEAVDVWSLGVICYTLLYGEMPFEEDTDVQTRIKVISNEPTYPNPTIEGPPLELIKQMLSKDPRLRPSIIDVLNHPWLGKEGKAQLKILGQQEYPPFITKAEKRLLRTFRAAQFDTDAVRESVSQNKCDPLAGTWALALHRELKIADRRARNRSSSHNHHGHSLSFSRYSLSRHDSTNSKASVLRKHSTGSRRSSSIGRHNVAGSQIIYSNSNASNQGFVSQLEPTHETVTKPPERSRLTSLTNHSNTNIAKLVVSGAGNNADNGLISPGTPNPPFVESQHDYWNGESQHDREDIKFNNTFPKDLQHPTQRTHDAYQGTIGNKATPDRVYSSNNVPNSKGQQHTLQDIFRDNLNSVTEAGINRSSISLPASNKREYPHFVDLTDNQGYTDATKFQVPSHIPNDNNTKSRDNMSEEQPEPHAKQSKHGWARLHSSSKSAHSSVNTSESTMHENLQSVPTFEKKDRKFVSAVKNAWMKLVVPSSSNGRKKRQTITQRPSASRSLFAGGGESMDSNYDSKDGSSIGTHSLHGNSLEGERSVSRESQLADARSVGNINVASITPIENGKLNGTQGTQNYSKSGPNSLENSAENIESNNATSSIRPADDTLTSLMPPSSPLKPSYKPRQGSYASAASIASRKSSTGSAQSNTPVGHNLSSNGTLLNGTSLALASGFNHTSQRQRPVSQISQFSTLSGLSQISATSSQISSSYDQHSFSELSSINGGTPVLGSSTTGSRTPRRHHSAGAPGTGGSGSGNHYLRRPYMGRRSTSSSLSSIQSYNDNTSQQGQSNTPNPGSNGSTFGKSHKKSHSKASSLSSLSINSGFSSAFIRDDLGRPRHRSESSPPPLLSGRTNSIQSQGDISHNESAMSDGSNATANNKKKNKTTSKQSSYKSHRTHHHHRSSTGGGASSFKYPPRMASSDSLRSVYSTGSLRSLRSTGSGTLRNKSSSGRRSYSGTNSSSRASSLSRTDSRKKSRASGSHSRKGGHNMMRGMSRGSSRRRSSLSLSRASSLSSTSSTRKRRQSLSSIDSRTFENSSGPSTVKNHRKSTSSSSGKGRPNNAFYSSSSLSYASDSSRNNSSTRLNLLAKNSSSSGGLGLDTVPRRPGSPFVAHKLGGGLNGSKSGSRAAMTNGISSPSSSSSKVFSTTNSGSSAADVSSRFGRMSNRKQGGSSSPAPPLSSAHLYRSGLNSKRSSNNNNGAIIGRSGFSIASSKSTTSRFTTIALPTSMSSSKRLGDARMPGIGEAPHFNARGGKLSNHGSVILEGKEDENSDYEEVDEEEEEEEQDEEEQEVEISVNLKQPGNRSSNTGGLRVVRDEEGEEEEDEEEED